MVRILRLLLPDVVTPVRTNRTAENPCTPPPIPLRRVQRNYNFDDSRENIDVHESPYIPFPDLKDEDTSQEATDIVASSQVRSREREFHRLAREYQYVNFEIRERRRINREKENQYNVEDDMSYIGIKKIAYMISKRAAKQYEKNKNFKKAIELYEYAYTLDPDLDAVGEIATMYENEHDYVNATIWYERAVNQCCVVSIFNFADMYDKIYKNTNDVTESKRAYDNMIKYYKIGTDLNDNACLAKLLVKCYLKLVSESEQCTTDKREKMDMEFMLYKYYVVMLQKESCECDDECECKVFDIYILHDDMGDNDFDIFHELKNDNSELLVIKKCEQLITSINDENDNRTIELNSIIKYLKSRQEYSIFRNKVALFTRLNHIVECSICYETKVNIDLRCAHTFCTDCYLKVYTNSCPICRCPCNN